MDYLIIDENTQKIKNIIVIEDNNIAQKLGAKEYYLGAKIGDIYFPIDLKKDRIQQTKQDLATFLSENPLLWTDGKYYSVTQEKQSLLTSNIATYQIEVQANPEAIITWNATGEECVQWDIQQLCALAVAIKDYVKPIVTYQQGLEIQINNCQSLEELNSIEINYDQFKQSN